MKTPEAERKAAEQKMQAEWRAWTKEHSGIFAEPPAGAGKTKRVTKQGVADVRNDIMLSAVVSADSPEAAGKLFEDHPHLGIPDAWIDVMPINPIAGGM